ncbi:MAG: LPXTG cell wall anchor domain-containing protein [Actinomycetota bacterium]|nr:LPXTG cell wall anchor domain-containing protein [Actinomycetota bacterium]
MKKTWLLLITALFALVLFAPAAMAQDDDDDFDDDAGVATSSATATATEVDDDDDTGSASAGATATAAANDDDDDALPETGGPALLAPIAGALLLAGGAASTLALRRSRNDS